MRDQARGNSGIYIQRRYEVQILDSFGLPPVFNGCGALYRQQSPELNMSFPPLAWQTYDIYFTAARWDPDGNKTSDAQITVMHNGVPIHRQLRHHHQDGCRPARNGVRRSHPVSGPRQPGAVPQRLAGRPRHGHAPTRRNQAVGVERMVTAATCPAAGPPTAPMSAAGPACPAADGWWLWKGI